MRRIAAAVLIAAAVTVTSAASATAHPGRRSDSGPVMPIVLAARVCKGVLGVTYTGQVLEGRRMVAIHDDGAVRLEAHEVSGRSGPDGRWVRIPATSGGEGHLRWAGYGASTTHGAHWQAVRVVRTDRDRIISEVAGINEGCAA